MAGSNCINPNFQLSNKVKLYLWNEKGEVLKILDVSNLKPGNITMDQPREVVLIGHGMAENGYSSEIQKLVTSIYSKRPNSDVYSIDWSELVSFCITDVLILKPDKFCLDCFDRGRRWDSLKIRKLVQQANGPTLYLVFPVIVIVISAMFAF